MSIFKKNRVHSDDKGQFSVEFLIGVGIIIGISAALLVFFFPLASNTSSQQAQMNSLCTYISNGIDSVVSSTGSFSVYDLHILNSSYVYYPYNISLSKGVVVITYNKRSASCGMDTLNTSFESFNLSNLAIYRNNSTLSVAFMYGNNGLNVPSKVYGGGFPTTVSLYLRYSNGTSVLLAGSLSSNFVYNLNLALSPGYFSLYAVDNTFPQVNVVFPFTVS